MASLSVWYRNKNYINEKQEKITKKIIDRRINNFKLEKKNLQITHIKFNKKIIDLLIKNKQSKFLKENFIQKMFFLHNRIFVFFELIEIWRDKNWKFYKKLLEEDDIGDPIRYFLYLKSSGNRINHVYQLKIFSDYTNVSLRKIQEVFEFGGGYGCMARIFSKINKKVKYIIFDTKLVNLLQFYYLKNIGLNVGFGNKQFKLTDKLSNNRKNIKNRLFLANWSLSETPITFRKKFIIEINRRDYFFISFQEFFEGIDNLKYFKSLKKNLSKKFDCEIIKNIHYRGNLFKKQNHYFFIGKKL